jgi:serine/threonine protein kinase
VQIDCRHFTYKDLEKITNKFEEEIGKGGFGSVYHGQLFDGQKVAVKVLDSSSHQGNKEFLAEVLLYIS